MGLWVGSYSGKGGRGFYPLQCENGRLRAGDPEPGIIDASFAVWSARHRLLYVVNEQDDGWIAAWRPGETWQLIRKVPSGGALPCYLALSHDGRWLACANYGDGSIAIFSINPHTGAPEQMVSSHRQTGRGPNAERQDGPHAHCVVFARDDRILYHVDLGLDRVFRHELEQGRIVRSDVALVAPDGSGPRHLLFHPSGLALLVCELNAQLMLLRHARGKLTCLDALPTAPEPTGEDNLGGHLAFDEGGDILVTNRGHDSLVRFGLRGNRIELLAWHPTGGRSPRHLQVIGDRAIVAHEESGGLVSVPVPGRGGDSHLIAPIPGAAFVLDIPE